MAVTFFGRDFALYRGESGRPGMLDAYCAHMGTHLTAGHSAMIVRNGKQIEGDSIRCPYHAWRYGPDGHVDDIPYHDGPCPKPASIRSYPVPASYTHLTLPTRDLVQISGVAVSLKKKNTTSRSRPPHNKKTLHT